MVNKDNNGNLLRETGARNIDIHELDISHGQGDLDLLKAIIDEWLVPVLVNAFIEEMSTCKKGEIEKLK